MPRKLHLRRTRTQDRFAISLITTQAFKNLRPIMRMIMMDIRIMIMIHIHMFMMHMHIRPNYEQCSERFKNNS